MSSCYRPSFPRLSLQASLTMGLIFPCPLAQGREVKVLHVPVRLAIAFPSCFQHPTCFEAAAPCFVVAHQPLSLAHWRLRCQPVVWLSTLFLSCFWVASSYPDVLVNAPVPPSSSSQQAPFMHIRSQSKPPLKSDHRVSPFQLSFLTLLMGHNTHGFPADSRLLVSLY